jgi:hypothetical protein
VEKQNSPVFDFDAYVEVEEAIRSLIIALYSTGPVHK